MTDMLHFYLKQAWEEMQAKNRKWMDPPELVPSRPDVNGMLNDLQKQRAENPIPPTNPIGKTKGPPKPTKMQKASARSKAERKKRKTANGKP